MPGLQDTFVWTLRGRVRHPRQTLPGAAVLVEEDTALGSPQTPQDDSHRVPHARTVDGGASFVGTQPETPSLSFRSPTLFQRFRLKQGTSLNEAEVVGDGPKDVTVQRIDPRLAKQDPHPTRNHRRCLAAGACQLHERTEQCVQRPRRIL